MSKMPERMTKEEAKIQQAIRAARIAKQTLLEENRDRMPLEVEEDLVKVKRPKAENVTIKVPNQDKEGFGLAGVENEYKIKKAQTPTSYDEVIQRVDKELASGDSPIKEILSLVRNMAYTKKRNNEPFTIDAFKQMLAEAKKEVSWMRFMGIKF